MAKISAAAQKKIDDALADLEQETGKALIRRIHTMAKEIGTALPIVFMENYDMSLASVLTAGVDLWLNNPRRPREASGTSGMKCTHNGVMNFSVLDGWWAEAFDGENGFAIGNGEIHANQEIQDQRDAESLFRILEEQVVPMYYDRGPDDIPYRWMARVKRSMRTLAWRFNADRMVMDYVRNCYLPAAVASSCQMPPA